MRLSNATISTPRNIVQEAISMSEVVTLRIPDQLARDARAIASSTHRQMEDVLLEWMDRAAANPPVESLTDNQVLALCKLQMNPAQQHELSELLARNEAGGLNAGDQVRLDELLNEYRRGMVRKAQALKVAVERGLQPPLSHAA
jgi:hypothetical protein